MTTATALTVTLTDRRPVTIATDEWPIVARAKGDSYVGSDQAVYTQAKGRGELDEWTLTLRAHADGRAIVYAVVSAASGACRQPHGGEDYRGGEILVAGADHADAIRRVGEAASLPDATIRDAIADLPAERL
jgi:hypothetical protein